MPESLGYLQGDSIGSRGNVTAERRNRVGVRCFGEIEAGLRINSGTYRLPVSGQDGTAYSKGIFLPNDDWRALSQAERSKLIDEAALGPNIDLFQIPGSSYDLFWNSDLSILADPKGPDVQSEAFSTVLKDIASHIPGPRPAIATTIILRPAGIPSSTYDDDAKLFIGLHVDDNDEKPPDNRRGTRVRCMINLGQDMRYFNFLTPTIDWIFSILGDTPAKTSYELAHAFMARFPDWPVLQVALRPGEGYIAPTQLMIHDGYTVEMTRPDITFTCLL